MSLLSATWQPLVSAGDFLEPPLAQLHKVFTGSYQQALRALLPWQLSTLTTSFLARPLTLERALPPVG